MNFFVEGLQGSGKTTLLNLLKDKHLELRAYPEGDYCPVELAWCAYMNKAQYESACSGFPELNGEIERNTFIENEHYIVTYTKICAEERFYKAFEQYEVYNGRIPQQTFDEIVLNRFANWCGEYDLFECALLQNTVEDKMLFADLPDDEIIGFYRRVKEALGGKDYHIFYLQTEDIRGNMENARRERVDEQGREAWFTIMEDYLANSPRGRREGLRGMDGWVDHLTRRQALELRILREIFPEQSVILPSKQYDKRFI